MTVWIDPAELIQVACKVTDGVLHWFQGVPYQVAHQLDKQLYQHMEMIRMKCNTWQSGFQNEA